VYKIFSTRQTLGAKTHKKCCHVDILEDIVLWSLASKFEGRVDKVLLSTNHIVGILCLLNQ
jgi:hypothetical protein